MLKHGILGLLNYGSMSGYEIMEVFKNSLNYFWNANTSQIYRELQNLKAKDFVTDKTIEQIGKPDKKLFTITEAGQQELQKWLREPFKDSTNNAVLMKVFFMGELTPEENLQRFKKLKHKYEGILLEFSSIHEISDQYEKNFVKNHEKSLYWKMTIDYGIRQLKMMTEWCQSCIEKLEKEISDKKA